MLAIGLRSGPPVSSARPHMPVAASGDAPPIPKGSTIKASEIEKTVRLIGRLGHPLGTIITIRGEWVGPTRLYKDVSDWPKFRVDTVNGERLDEVVEISRGNVVEFTRGPGHKPQVGETWEMKGSELGEYRGLPSEMYTDLYGKPDAVQTGHGFDFYTYFVWSHVMISGPTQDLEEGKQ